MTDHENRNSNFRITWMREDIIKLAEAANFIIDGGDDYELVNIKDLERFYALAVAEKDKEIADIKKQLEERKSTNVGWRKAAILESVLVGKNKELDEVKQESQKQKEQIAAQQARIAELRYAYFYTGGAENALSRTDDLSALNEAKAKELEEAAQIADRGARTNAALVLQMLLDKARELRNTK